MVSYFGSDLKKRFEEGLCSKLHAEALGSTGKWNLEFFIKGELVPDRFPANFTEVILFHPLS